MKTSAKTRDRLVSVAAQLFYTEGITACGVDKVVREAGITKPTLYSHYRSKAELVAAALTFQHQTRRRMIEDYLGQRQEETAEQRILAVFDWLEAWSSQQGSRGCAFLNASVELVGVQDDSARQIIRQHKEWWQALLAGLAREAGVAEPDRLADELLILIDGVNARVLVTGQAKSAQSARRIAGLLLEESPRRRSSACPPGLRAGDLEDPDV